MENNYLTHHGVKGMKWGVRKSQKRLARERRRQADWSDDAKDAAQLRKKKASQLSNVELRRLNDRTRMEQEYSRLNPSTIKKGIAAVTAMAALATTAVSLYNSGSKIVKIGGKVVSRIGDSLEGVGVDSLDSMADKW